MLPTLPDSGIDLREMLIADPRPQVMLRVVMKINLGEKETLYPAGLDRMRIWSWRK